MLTRSRQDPTRFAQQLFQGLPRRYDLLAEALSFGQNRRWRRAMVDSVVDGGPATVLDVATGTAGVALQLARRTGARVTGIDITEAMLRRGRAAVRQEGLQARIALVGRSGRTAPVPGRHLRRADLHLPVALRRRPGRDARRARPRGPTGRRRRQPRVPRPTATAAARRLVALHARGPARSRRVGGPGVVPRRPLPRPEHLRPLRPLLRRLDGRCVAAGRASPTSASAS